MRKILILMCALLGLGVSGAWATEVTWESLHGWTQSSGGVGSFNWYGAHTPGDNTINYTMSSIQLKQSSGNNNTNYLAIAAVSPGSSTTIAGNNVLAVSSNSIKAITSTLYEYTFSSPVSLTGGTTYYLVFVSANTPTDGAYTIQSGRMEVNHLNCYSYPYGNNANVDWTPYFKATLTTTESTKHYSYSCTNLAGFFLNSGYLLQNTDPTTGDAPSIAGYTCQSATVDATGVIFTYALTSNPLASATTAPADMATKPKYTIIESKAGGYVYYTEDGGDVKAYADETGDKTHWIVVGDEANGYKLYNALTGISNVAVVADGNDKPIQMLAEASNTASLFDIRYISGAHRLYKKGTKYCTNRLSSGTRIVGIHTNVNDGSKVDVSRYNKTITYKLKWGDVEKASESVSVPTGDDPADYLPDEWDYPYCDLTCDVSYVTTETSTVNVTMDWDGPFDFSTDFASAKWYYMQIGGKYVVSNAETNCPAYAAKQVKETGLWAFVGNPYDGFYIINYASGEGKRLDINGTCSMKAPSAYNIIQIKKVGDDCRMYNYDPDGSYFLFVDVDNYIKGGSEYEILCSALFTPVNWGELAIASLDAYAESHAPGKYFGTDEGLILSTKAGIEAMGLAFTKALYESIDYSTFVKYPETGYYRIKNNETGRYIGYGQPTAIGLSKDAGLIAMPSANASTDASSVIYFNGSAGTYKLSMQGLYVQSQTTGSETFPATASSPGVDFVFTHDNYSGIASITNAASYVDTNMDGSLHNPSEGWILPGVVNWKASAAASKWVVEDAEEISVSLNGDDPESPTSYYATFCAPFSYTVSGATAYTLAASGNWLVPTPIDGEVAAGTPVLLKSTTGNTATLTIGTSYAATPLSGTALTGTYTATTIDGATDYVLGIDGGVVGFYHWSSNDLAANRAYLDKSTAPGVKGFAINWDFTDGIDAIQVVNGQQTKDAAIYNLAGQRVQKAQKGIYIQNGKKMFVK